MTKSVYFIFIFFACQTTPQDKIKIITAERLKSLQKEGIEIIDIRTPNEYAEGHIFDAQNIDFMSSNFLSSFEVLKKDTPIIIHCASGGRSARAASQLIDLGFTKVYDYSGGFSNWKKRGEKIDKE